MIKNMKNVVVRLLRKILPTGAIRRLEKFYRTSRIKTVSVVYGFPAKGLRVIAVTGTNGKTTTCAYINQILKTAGYKTAMFTTALIEVEGKAELNRSHTTVPFTAELQKFFRAAKAAKADFVVMEVTSHSLDQYKLAGTPIEVAVITNLTQEHLDYHRTMEKYAAAKARLLTQFSPKFVLLNRDNEWFDFFKQRTSAPVISFGKRADSTLRIGFITNTDKGTDFTLGYEGTKKQFKTALLGEFNVYNSTAAIGAAYALDLTPQQAKDGVEALIGVPGRMEEVMAGQNYKIFVDYAVTPDALMKALQAVKEIAGGKVILVFGATGDRDKTKRPLMGEVATKHADKIYLTDDETYTEDAQTIRNMVRQGIEKAGGLKKCQEIGDRRIAIGEALKEARAGDIILVTGIGHQQDRNMGGQLEPWNDPEVVKELLADS